MKSFFTVLLKFSPVFLLAGLMISKVDALIAAPLAAIYAVIIARIVCKIKLQDSLDSAMKSVSNILIALFILMFAYAMASAFMSTGVGAAVVNLSLLLGVTGKTVAVVGIMCTAILSVATGGMVSVVPLPCSCMFYCDGIRTGSSGHSCRCCTGSAEYP